MRQLLTTLINAFLWVIILVLLFLVSSGLYQRFVKKDGYTGFFGIGYAVVVSGSMEPAISVNDMIVYMDVDPGRIEVGDVIVYSRVKDGEEILITHRLTEKGSSSWITKGDANSAADAPVALSSVVGKVVFAIPGAGTVVSFLKSWIGICVMFGLIAFLILLSILIFDIRGGRESVETVNGKQTVKY